MKIHLSEELMHGTCTMCKCPIVGDKKVRTIDKGSYLTSYCKPCFKKVTGPELHYDEDVAYYRCHSCDYRVPEDDCFRVDGNVYCEECAAWCERCEIDFLPGETRNGTCENCNRYVCENCIHHLNDEGSPVCHECLI